MSISFLRTGIPLKARTLFNCFRLLLICLLLIHLVAGGCGGNGGGPSPGGTIGLAWNANTESDLAGYKVYYGWSAGAYANSVDVGMATEYNGTVFYDLTGLTQGQIYYVAVTAYDTAGNESGYSNEISALPK